MNYFEFYCGDYARDTAHLSLAEHGAFLLLMSAYYSTEKPLPADYVSLFRIARAMSASEQKAVRAVADEFFPVADDGLRHNARADREIEKAKRRIGTARDNGRKGGRPTKENPAGYPMGNPTGNPPDNPPGFDPLTGSEPAGKAHHTPHAIAVGSTEASAKAFGGTDAGRACLLMRQAGCVQTNPSHVDLAAALSEGVTPETLADTVREGIEAGKRNPFTWAIATARSRHADGPKPITGGTHANCRTGGKLSVVERVARVNAEAEQRQRGDSIDGECRVVG